MTQIIGILNITPDSFSDGGKYTDAKSIIAQTKKLIEDGADVIDIGAESTRPGADKLSDGQEWKRLVPVLSKIIDVCHAHGVQASLDTYHSESARKAIALGIDWINDVNGFKDPLMIEAVKNSNVKLVVMHSLSVPADKAVILNEDADVFAEVLKWGKAQIDYLTKSGIEKSHIIFDPGIGFSKTAKQSWELLDKAMDFKSLGVSVYIGHSKKSFLGDTDRDAETLKISRRLIAQGIDYIRVHDVRAHKNLTS